MRKLLLGIITLCVSLGAGVAQAQGPPQVITGPEVTAAIGPYVFQGDLRDLPVVPDWQPGEAIKEIPRRHNGKPVDASPVAPWQQGGVTRDPLMELQERAPAGSALAFDTPIVNFDGAPFSGVNPPDTVGEAGPDHFIQMINGGGGALFRIYDKSGTLVAGPTALDSLGSGSCATGFGDPIVLWDELAQRWLMSEFALFGNHLCVYISQGADPITSGWFSYDFSTPSFPDYPKYAVWSDAYYVGSNESSPALYALDRTQMLAGLPATSQRFTVPDLSGFGFQMLNPSDIDGGSAPPAGSPNYFMRHKDDEVHSGGTDPTMDFLEIFEFSVDFATPANSTVTGPISVGISEIDSNMCGLFAFSCFEQPGTSTELDPLREPVMWRVAYRNFGTHETMVGNLVTDASVDQGAVRWFELRKVGAGGWSLFQEGTYSVDGDSRFMGSAAMDQDGNIAVGYNVTSSSTSPSLRYAGRLASDPLGTLPNGENVFINGSGSNSSNRYGDYSSLNVDPVDGCTFWFTGEYNTSSQWSTRIAAFKFDSCGGVGGGFTLLPVIPGTAGGSNDFSTTGGTPSGRVFFLSGTSGGTTNQTISGCGTVALDFGGTVRRLGGATNDGSGDTTLTRSIPGGASGSTLHIQAFDQGTCTKSNVVIETF
jgi:hypothetical protein